MTAWNTREEWATDMKRRKALVNTRFSAQRDGGEGEKVMQKDTSLNIDSTSVVYETLFTGNL